MAKLQRYRRRGAPPPPAVNSASFDRHDPAKRGDHHLRMPILRKEITWAHGRKVTLGLYSRAPGYEDAGNLEERT